MLTKASAVGPDHAAKHKFTDKKLARKKKTAAVQRIKQGTDKDSVLKRSLLLCRKLFRISTVFIHNVTLYCIYVDKTQRASVYLKPFKMGKDLFVKQKYIPSAQREINVRHDGLSVSPQSVLNNIWLLLLMIFDFVMPYNFGDQTRPFCGPIKLDWPWTFPQAFLYKHGN